MSEFYGDDSFEGNSFEDSQSVDISTSLFGLKLNTPLSNASGVHCTRMTELSDLMSCNDVGYLTSKSCTLKLREGNPEPRYYDTIAYVENGSVNSMGIPNMGIDYYLTYRRAYGSRFTKPYVISVSGLSPDENLSIFSKIENSDVQPHAIEFNLSCPNIIGKPQIGLDFESTRDLLSKVFESLDKPICPIGLKLPPYFDIVHRIEAANVIDDFHKSLSFLTCINSPGNGLIIDINSESTVIYPKEGQGGIGGDFAKPFALANVRSFYELLGDKLDIIGCGGVKNGSDVFEHILCGATAVQVGTLIARKGINEFKKLNTELKDIMRLKGYTSLSQFKGKLKNISKL